MRVSKLGVEMGKCHVITMLNPDGRGMRQRVWLMG